jgi:hypothetical protein
MFIAKVSFIYKNFIHKGEIDENQQVHSKGEIYINAAQWCNNIRADSEESVFLGIGNIIPYYFDEVKKIILCSIGNCTISSIYDMPNSDNLFITAKFTTKALAKNCLKKLKENKLFGNTLHLRIRILQNKDIMKKL